MAVISSLSVHSETDRFTSQTSRAFLFKNVGDFIAVRPPERTRGRVFCRLPKCLDSQPTGHLRRTPSLSDRSKAKLVVGCAFLCATERTPINDWFWQVELSVAKFSTVPTEKLFWHQLPSGFGSLTEAGSAGLVQPFSRLQFLASSFRSGSRKFPKPYFIPRSCQFRCTLPPPRLIFKNRPSPCTAV